MGWNHQLGNKILYWSPEIFYAEIFSQHSCLTSTIRTRFFQLSVVLLNNTPPKTNMSPEQIVWANYNDVSRGHPTWWFNKGTSPKSPKKSGFGIILICPENSGCKNMWNLWTAPLCFRGRIRSLKRGCLLHMMSSGWDGVTWVRWSNKQPSTSLKQNNKPPLTSHNSNQQLYITTNNQQLCITTNNQTLCLATIFILYISIFLYTDI